MDFGALPPEINSARMYAGAGAGPMMAAASAWNSLGSELSTAAASYESVISTLTGAEWLGPSSVSMAAAAQPYVAWLNTTSGFLQQAASQAIGSAAAYETAFAMTVPPPAVAANRAQLAALVATNFLGINTPAIMATEAHYMEMWAQDAVAMYSYAASSSVLAQLSPLTPPAPNTTPGAVGAQVAAASGAAANSTQAAGLNGLVSNLGTSVGQLASPLSAAPASSGFLDSLNNLIGTPFISNGVNGAVNTTAWFVMNTIPTAVALSHTLGAAPAAAAGLASADTAVGGLGTVLAGSAAPAGAAGFGGAPVLAGLGQASSVGGLSVPAAWSAATPAGTGSATLAGTGWTAAAEGEAGVTALPAGMPSVASAGRGGLGFGAPRYGIKPTVMPKQVLV
jgi:PPE-repeat protein